jgi:uncharacterized protein YdhG (YjbR/CyaY superfamily)
MNKIKFPSVDDYIALQPAANQARLEQVRAAIRRALPKAEEVISYNIPAFKLNGKVALYFAGWKQHYSVYPAGARMDPALLKELARYEMSKGTIRFPLGEPVPVRLIERIAKFRAKQLAEKSREITRTRAARDSRR